MYGHENRYFKFILQRQKPKIVEKCYTIVFPCSYTVVFKISIDLSLLNKLIINIKTIKAINRSRIKDIAQKANVSIGTVDRVIHNRGEVSKTTRDLILSIIEELEYQPNILASALASKRKFSFALFISEPISVEGYWNKPLVGVRKAYQEIQQYGVDISIHLFKQSDSQTFIDKAESIIQNRPDGVVLAPFFSREAKLFISELKKLEIPYVFIDSNIKDSDKLCYIGQDSFQSGMLAAKLMDYSVPGNAPILILHFAKELDNLNHLVQREKGFYEYFKKNDPESLRNLITLEIADPTNSIFSETMETALNTKPAINGIFVTNSKVYYLAKFLEQTGRSGVRVIGHDLISENIDYLKKGIVDFLICQRPEEQGYNAVYALFDHIITKKAVKTDNYTSIDIITKENFDYYK